MPRLWVANAEEALPEGDPFYAEVVASKTMRMFPRFLLCLQPGDCLVAPVAMPQDFAAYVAGLLRLGDPARLWLEVTGPSSPYSLVDSILQDPGSLEALRARATGDGWSLEPFMESPRILGLSQRSGIPLHRSLPERVLGGRIGQLNDKGWFKRFAEGLGIATVPGLEVDSRRGLEEALERMAREHRDVMLRKVSYAGGAGNIHGSGPALLKRIPTWYREGTVLVEPFLEIDAVAGSLAWIGPTGVRFVGIDLQLMRQGGFCGFDFPYPEGPGATRVRQATLKVAEEIRRDGVRGYLNLDWAFPSEAPESPLVLECNFRHNGFAYVTEFASRYFGPGWEGMAIHSREGLPTSAGSTRELLARLSGLEVEGEPVLLEAPGRSWGAAVTSPPEGGSFSVAVFDVERRRARQALALVEEAA